VAQALGLAEKLRGADLVVTGEGEINGQTMAGKVPLGVAKVAEEHGVPVIALVGRLGSGWEVVLEHGILAVVPIAPGPISMEESKKRAAELLKEAAGRVCALVEVGKSLQ